jgi:hypothetical protein
VAINSREHIPGMSTLRELAKRIPTYTQTTIRDVVEMVRAGGSLANAADYAHTDEESARAIVLACGRKLGQSIKVKKFPERVTLMHPQWSRGRANIGRSCSWILCCDTDELEHVIERCTPSAVSAPEWEHYRDCWYASHTRALDLGQVITKPQAAGTYLLAAERLEHELRQLRLSTTRILERARTSRTQPLDYLQSRALSWHLLPAPASAETNPVRAKGWERELIYMSTKRPLTVPQGLADIKEEHLRLLLQTSARLAQSEKETVAVANVLVFAPEHARGRVKAGQDSGAVLAK